MFDLIAGEKSCLRLKMNLNVEQILILRYRIY